MFESFLAASVPTFNPQQFSNVPPPSSISNLPGFQTIFEPRSNDAQTLTSEQPSQPNVFGNNNSVAAVSHTIGRSTTTNVSFDQSNLYSQAPPSVQTYSTYPQVQQMTTPISLPGMPPITVSTSIPPAHFAYANPPQPLPPTSQ